MEVGEHVYQAGDRIERVLPGFPHGDAWGAIVNPNAPPTHDVERHLKRLEELAKKAKAKKAKKNG